MSRIRERNTSSYSFLINLGDSEYLVCAPPPKPNRNPQPLQPERVNSQRVKPARSGDTTPCRMTGVTLLFTQSRPL